MLQILPPHRERPCQHQTPSSRSDVLLPPAIIAQTSLQQAGPTACLLHVQDGWGSLVIVLIGAHLAALLFWLFQLAKTSSKKPEGKQE